MKLKGQEFICHEYRQLEADVTEVAASAARVLAQTSGSQHVPTSELVDVVAKSIQKEKDENEKSTAPTSLEFYQVQVQMNSNCRRSCLRSGKKQDRRRL